MEHESVPERLKRQLGLIPHPSESGLFRETFRGDRQVTYDDKTSDCGPRSTGTIVYFLLEAPNFVTWHKHKSDCAFFWHAGHNVKFHILNQDGSVTCHILGDVVKHGDCIAHVNIPPGCFYATEIDSRSGFVLYSCVVMPGFEFADWCGGKREEMVAEHPQHTQLITRLTRT